MILENAKWYEALVAIDGRGDKKPLIKLLQSGQPVPPSIAFYIGDLLDRYTQAPKARPRTPAYSRTSEQIKLIAAVIDVHGWCIRSMLTRPKHCRKSQPRRGCRKKH